MTLYLVVAIIVFLSMGKSVFQAFAEAAAPRGMSLILRSYEMGAEF